MARDLLKVNSFDGPILEDVEETIVREEVDLGVIHPNTELVEDLTEPASAFIPPMANKVTVVSGDEVSKLAAKINPGYKEFAEQSHETEIFIRQVKEAEELVRKCEQIKWNIVKRVHQMKELSLVVKNAKAKLERGSWLSHVHVLKDIVIGFDEQVMDLKRVLLKESLRGGVDDSHAVVISGGAGCGKTTLATMLCHDPEIEATNLAKCCRKLPLALIIIGNLLSGTRVDEWRLMLSKLSQGPQAVLLDLEMDKIWQSSLATCLGV
ncbi:probable disease resistance protein [Tanacetum coccineum]